MKAILGDNNIEGHLDVLLRLLEGENWREFWEDLNLALLTFDDVGLSGDASDAIVWQLCQQQEMILLTANRNQQDPDSLEATMRAGNTANSLPVFTIATAQRFLDSRDYAELVVAKMLEYLQDIERYRGAGRLYLP